MQNTARDSLRSVMYRSFVTCDDSKGVIEGKTIKKSRIGPRNSEKQRDSKVLAKDLLKGAFDLQESLAMLGKLQEASEYMTKLRKREVDATGVGRTKSERVADERWNSNKVEFGKRSLSVDYSRDCYDELREVIRDSLARQNLLPPCCASEKSCSDRRKVDLNHDFASSSFTSSSESSIEKACLAGRKLVMSPEFPSSSSSQFASSDCSPVKTQPKVPNLIARLMGLEEIPSMPLHQKQVEKDKIFKQRRPIFEINLPKAKKLAVVSQKADPKRRTLDGIIETMQFKGLLRFKSNNVICHQSKSSADDAPPIVIMKPVYAPELQAQRFSASIRDENPLDTKDSFGKWNLKEENSPVNFTIFRKMQTRKVQNSSCIPEQRSKDHSEAPASQKTNEVVTPLTKNRAFSPGRTKQPKKEEIEKRIERTQRAPGAKNAGPNNTTKVQDRSTKTTAKVRKPEKKSNAPEKLVASKNSADSKCITAVASRNSRNSKKNVKTDKSVKSSSIVPIIENMEHKDEPDSDITITKVTSLEELPCEEVAEISQNVVIDDLKNGECSAAESTVPLIQRGHDIPLIKHTRCQVKSKATTRHILLSNESFLSRAEELFDTDAWEPTVWKTINVDNEMPNSMLVLDCAKELLEYKRSQYTVQAISKTPVNMSRVSISFDKLLNEICGAIEVLKSYGTVDANSLSVDTLYALHERDISRDGVISTTWDLGWRNAYTLDEVEQIVTVIEKHVVNGIIDDVVTEFAL
ncbi:putative protein isoform X1 [Capsicum chacoense]